MHFYLNDISVLLKTNRNVDREVPSHSNMHIWFGCVLVEICKRPDTTDTRKGVDGLSHEIIGGGHKRRLSVWGTKVPSVGSRGFFVKLYIRFALKYNKQQLLLLLDKINDITYKILGGHYVRPPFITIGGTCPPVPSIGIYAPDTRITILPTPSRGRK